MTFSRTFPLPADGQLHDNGPTVQPRQQSRTTSMNVLSWRLSIDARRYTICTQSKFILLIGVHTQIQSVFCRYIHTYTYVRTYVYIQHTNTLEASYTGQQCAKATSVYFRTWAQLDSMQQSTWHRSTHEWFGATCVIPWWGIVAAQSTQQLAGCGIGISSSS